MSDDTITGSDIEAAMSASGSSQESTPSAESTPAVSASAETTPPPEGTPPPDATQTSTVQTPGAPPEHRWPSILENQRKEAAEKAVADYRQQHGWAEQVDPREFQQIQTIARHLSGPDKVAGLQALIAEIRKDDPTFETQIRSFAARTLAQRPPQAETQEPQPDLPIQLEDGRVVHLYSADQQAKREAFLQQQWMAKVQQELQPLKQSHEQRQAAVAKAERDAQSVQQAEGIFQEISVLPGVTDQTLEQMAHVIAADPQLPHGPARSKEEVALAAFRAYHKVVVPSLNASARQAVLSEHTLKAQTNTVSPHHQSAAAPKSYDDLSWSDAFKAELASRR